MNQNPPEPVESQPPPERLPSKLPGSASAAAHIPNEKRDRFVEVAALLEQFGGTHLDPELTEFTLELWRRICRRQTMDSRRGKPHIWAASVVHVIARMNFLFDRSQPVHVTFDTICSWFQTSKTTVGGKATEIERLLRLRQFSEPGLCRRAIIESFTLLELPNGMVLPLRTAKEMGLVPPDAMPE